MIAPLSSAFDFRGRLVACHVESAGEADGQGNLLATSDDCDVLRKDYALQCTVSGPVT